MHRDTPPDDRTGNSFVTLHAVIRFAQHILGVRLDPNAVAELSPLELTEAHCVAAGTTVDAVREAIAASPGVRCARELGMSQVGTARFRALLRDGLVITIVEPHIRPRGGFRSEPSREEARRQTRQAEVRRRRRPRSIDAAEMGERL